MIEFRSYRVPHVGGVLFADPPWDRAAAVLHRNRERASKLGGELGRIRESARRQLIDDAAGYTSAYRDVPARWSGAVGRSEDRPVVMAGHQPTLFHPGVWVKNFALGELARVQDAIAINLIVDQDVAGPPTIALPEASRGIVYRRGAVAYDGDGGGLPHEQTSIRSPEIFQAFDRRVRERIRPWVDHPCVSELWGQARVASRRTSRRGEVLAEARHRLEGDLGLETLEIPVSAAVTGTAFADFLGMIVRDAERFRGAYNDAVDLYRTAHGIRSRSHPVPNLGRQDGWIELPLWLYGDADPVRRSVWVRRQAKRVTLSDRAGRCIRLDARSAGWSEAIGGVEGPQWKLRPRALLTTMYARLVLSDLFLHGIGGGKYDQLTDLIIREFFGVEPPEFVVLSATERLPGCDTVAGDVNERIACYRRMLRDTRYRPERFFLDSAGVLSDPTDAALWSLGHTADTAGLIARKQELLRQIPPRGRRRAWHHEIGRVNDELAAPLSEIRERLERALEMARRERASRAVLTSREYAFCLFPLGALHASFRQMLGRRTRSAAACPAVAVP